MSSKRVRQQNRAALVTPAVSMLAIISAVAIMLASLIAVGGCQSSASKIGSAPPDRSKTVETAAAGVGQSAQAIDEARADATAKAPEVQPESDRIGTETARLRQYQRDLEIAVGDLRATRKHVDALAKAVEERDAEVARARAEVEKVKAEAESRWKRTMQIVLAGIAGVALVLGVVAFLVSKNLPLGIACAVIVMACIGATKLLDWGPQIAIGMLVLIAAGIAYAVWRQSRVSHELVLTAEAFKKTDPNDKNAIERAADQLQSEATKVYVRSVRGPIQRKLAQVEAFAKKV